MKNYVALFCVLASLYANSQNSTFIDYSALQSAHFNKRSFNPNSDSRSEQVVMALDYALIDENNVSGEFQYSVCELNKNYPNNSRRGTMTTTAVRFDTLVQILQDGQVQSFPLPSAKITLDSFDIYYVYHNNDQIQDTLTVSVLKGSTFGIVDTGILASLAGDVLWADTSYIMSGTYSTNDWMVHTKFPQLTLPRGEHFVIKVDFAADTADMFLISRGDAHPCNNSCGVEPSSLGLNSYSYVNNITNSGINKSGINRQFSDCNHDGIITPGMCESFNAQNFGFIPYITADIELVAYFDSDTFAFCNGATTLQPHITGAEGPVTYNWSPSTGLSSDTAANPTIAMPTNPILYTLTVSDSTSIYITTIFVTANQSSCDIIDTISGIVYFDSNNNSQYESGEYVLVNTAVKINNRVILTDSTGRYTVTLPRNDGAYSISLVTPFVTYTYNTPATGVYTGLLNGNLLNSDFAIHSTGDSVNLFVIMLNPANPPRPGFNSKVNALCPNPTSTNIDVVFEMVYDSLQSYQDASPAPDNVNQTTRTVTWNTTLSALSQTAFSLQLYTPPTVQLSTILRTRAYLTLVEPMVEIDTVDNAVVYEEIVVGSYDPNDKAVSPVGKGPDGRMLPGQNLQYTIRFQNTGTFYAENVAVRDTLDTDLDLSTFRMLSASHRYEYTFNGNVITWNFNQIMLQDSNTNEPESHGYISYAIAMKDDVVDLSPISNTAYIYFDFNEAIVTNTTLSTVDYNLNVGIAEAGAGTSVKVYPNPFKGETNFVLGSECNGASLKIYNLTGQLVDQKDNLTEGIYTYSAKKLATGMYNYLIVNSGGILAKGKMIAE